MREPANDHGVLLDPDEAEQAQLAARYARIKHAAMNYAGRTDLLMLGVAVCRELRAVQAELETAARAKISRPDLLALVTTKSDELAAIEEAMDDATKIKLWDAISRLSVAP